MADSCAGDPNCAATKTVDLVIAVKPSSALSTAGAAPAALVGQTDSDPAHWALSGYEKPQRIQQRIFGDDPPTLVTDFPGLQGTMTLNGCEQPAFRTFTQPSGANLANIVVEVTVFEPAASRPSALRLRAVRAYMLTA